MVERPGGALSIFHFLKKYKCFFVEAGCPRVVAMMTYYRPSPRERPGPYSSWCVAARCQYSLQPATTLRKVCAELPEMPQRCCQPQAYLCTTLRAHAPPKYGSEVIMLHL